MYVLIYCRYSFPKCQSSGSNVWRQAYATGWNQYVGEQVLNRLSKRPLNFYGIYVVSYVVNLANCVYFSCAIFQTISVMLLDVVARVSLEGWSHQ